MVDTKPEISGRQAAKLLRRKRLVPKKGLEPPHPCEYMDLNHARLPIPPLRHGTQVRILLTGSIFESRKSGGACQIQGRRGIAVNYRPALSGVFTPLRSISTDFACRVARVSSRLASVIQRRYSFLWV